MTDTLLEDLDLALAGDPAADAGLLALVADVRDQAPQMTTAFAAALDERVRAGFAADSRRAARRCAAAAARSCTCSPRSRAAAVASPSWSARRRDKSRRSSRRHGRPSTARPRPGHGTAPSPPRRRGGARPPTSAASRQRDRGHAERPAASARPGPRLATAAPGRRVERTTQLSLTTTTDDVQAVAAGVVARPSRPTASSSSSQVQIDGDEGSAAFTLRIPSAQPGAGADRAHPPRPGDVDEPVDPGHHGEFASTNARLGAAAGAARRAAQAPADA